MKFFPTMAMALILGLTLTLTAGDAEAKRMGSAKSYGMKRQATTQDKAPAAAPDAAKSSPTGTGAQAQPRRSFMGPIAGLAAGLGLAALASHFGFGEEMASMLMIGLLIMVAITVFGFIMRRRSPTPTPALAGAGSLGGNFRYAADQALPASRSLESSRPASGANIPADFDVAGFVRNAKVHFIRLQAANDARNLDDLREFTTPEMFAELKMDIAERGDAPQQTDVLEIDADVIEVVEEGNRYVVSVRFTALIREEDDVPAARVEEIWHLVKPRSGDTGWLLAGIQQVQ